MINHKNPSRFTPDRRLTIWFAGAALAVLLLAIMLSAGYQAQAAQLIVPGDDAFVDLNNGTTNYDCGQPSGGGLDIFYSDFQGFVSTRSAYLKFDLSGITQPADGSLLHVTVTHNNLPGGGEANVSLYSVSDDGWNEATLTYDNRPAAGATPLDTISVSAGTTGNLVFGDPNAQDPVGTFVEAERLGDGTASFALQIESGTDLGFAGGIGLEDRENCRTPGDGDEPNLDIRAAPTATPSPTGPTPSETPAPVGTPMFLPLIQKENAP